uniref:VRR-NUC domain-containing protein n=1 Tax=Thermus tengchongensis TaxID=1214928 RepID=A0A7V4EG14_9DEIN
MPGGKGPKRKGTRAEREALRLLREAGLEARRVPLSGSAPGYPGDLVAYLPGLGEVVVEVKARRRFGLEGWLEGRGLLVLRPDRRPPLAVMRLEDLLKALGVKEEA